MTDFQTQALVDAFVASCDERFAILELDHALTRELRCEVFEGSAFKVVRPQDVGDRFYVLSLSLGGKHITVEITYGDRDYTMNCLIMSGVAVQPFALWEWLEALERRDLLPDSGGWVMTPERVNALLATYEQLLRQFETTFTRPPPGLLKQMASARQQRVQAERDRMAEDEHQRLSARASDAFRRKEYRLVVDALEAVRTPLTAAELAKLQFARNRQGKVSSGGH